MEFGMLSNLPIKQSFLRDLTRTVAEEIWKTSFCNTPVLHSSEGYVDVGVRDGDKERVTHETILMRIGYSKKHDILFLRMPPITKAKGEPYPKDFYGKDLCPCCHKPLGEDPVFDPITRFKREGEKDELRNQTSD